MTAKEIITKFKDWVQQKKGTTLNLDACEEAILAYSLEGKSYKQMKIPNYELNTITNIKGPKLFQRLSEITATDVNKKNCKLVLIKLLEQNNEQAIERTSNYISTKKLIDRAPSIGDFYGREQELSDLQTWIVTECCCLIGVVGMSLIGKSMLVRELVENIQEHFEYVIWKNLENSLALEEILTDIEYHLVLSNLETNIERRISNLIIFLNQHRCLLVFDQWEGVMANAETSEKQQTINSYYDKFLRRIGESKHKSCLVFTSLQRPKVMDLFIGKPQIRQLSLSGLKNQDAKILLTDLGLVEPGIDKLIEIYQGHPLALNIAADIIKNLHNGQIDQFLEGTLFMSDVMNDSFDKQISYLPNIAINIMKYLAAETEPKLISQFFQTFPSYSKAQIIKAVNKLWQIRLIEKEDIQEDKILWVLNPLIKGYIKRRYN